MNRVKAAGSVIFASRDTAPVGGTPQYYTVGNPQTSTPATVVPGYFLNMVMDEICQVITDAGLTLDDTDWGQLSKALRKTALFNVQQFTTSTRVSMTGNGGNSYTVTPWSGFNYVKLSGTSKLIIQLNAPSLADPLGTFGASGSNAKLHVGAQTLEVVASNSQPATSAGNTSVLGIISGLGAGSAAISLDYLRHDTTAWNSIFCPTSADESYYPATSNATLIIQELGP